MPSTQHFQIFIDCKDKEQIAPDSSAGYELVLSEELQGWGAAEGKSVMYPIITIQQDGELSLPQTFTFVIDGKSLQIGKSYRATLQYKVNTQQPLNGSARVRGQLDFTLTDKSTLEMPLQTGHGPCMGRTAMCFSW
ncbi:hypothetical protein [Pseudomonas sp. KU43P]|uniref:hypothetical protein n=1 Tax=Pseudomonas sp. KU43P TaxID=2487887 RepID=UPI0012AA97F6|nr:hypothetical protein [Pseudomonas sp. KU43P]BBH44657.1 hypothetical protein KU43P_11340 [Pseudomonas sp. KU43P]